MTERNCAFFQHGSLGTVSKLNQISTIQHKPAGMDIVFMLFQAALLMRDLSANGTRQQNEN